MYLLCQPAFSLQLCTRNKQCIFPSLSELCFSLENALFVESITGYESMTYFASLILHHLSCLSLCMHFTSGYVEVQQC